MKSSPGIKLFGAVISPRATANDRDRESNNSDNPVPGKVITCPRCKSMDTKFCYFNNYNVNQPRHFCRGCQRYWTAGGALRDVPIGGGRRKGKIAGELPELPYGYFFDGSSSLKEIGFIDIPEFESPSSRGFGYHFPAKKRR